MSHVPPISVGLLSGPPIHMRWVVSYLPTSSASRSCAGPGLKVAIHRAMPSFMSLGCGCVKRLGFESCSHRALAPRVAKERNAIVRRRFMRRVLGLGCEGRSALARCLRARRRTENKGGGLQGKAALHLAAAFG